MDTANALNRVRWARVEEMEYRLTTLDGMKADAERELAAMADAGLLDCGGASNSGSGALCDYSFLPDIETRHRNLRATLRIVERERAQLHCDLALTLKFTTP